jgi:hypothetical protein
MSIATRQAALNAAVLRIHGQTALTDAGTIVGVLSDRFVMVDEVEERAPTFTVRDCDAEARALRKGSSLRIGDVHYAVRRLEPDGSGMTRLILEQ